MSTRTSFDPSAFPVGRRVREAASDLLREADLTQFPMPECPWPQVSMPGQRLERDLSDDGDRDPADGDPQRKDPQRKDPQRKDPQRKDPRSEWISPEALTSEPITIRFEYPLESYRQPEGDLFGVETLELAPDAEGESGEQDPDAGRSRTASGNGVSGRDRQFADLLVSECRKSEQRGHREGLQAGFEAGVKSGSELGLARGREEASLEFGRGHEAERERLTAQVAALLQSFTDAQEGYLHRLEQESVRLALAIAARILRREVGSDPLLLTGAVRVALGQLAASTVVRLRVPASDEALWRDAVAHLPNLAVRPEVVGDPRFDPGACRLETELGSANLALSAQLSEIERGFFPSETGVTSESGTAEFKLDSPTVEPGPWGRGGGAASRQESEEESRND